MRVKLGASNLSVTAAPCHLPFQGRQAAAAGILPQSARSADSPLYEEGAFGYKQNGR